MKLDDNEKILVSACLAGKPCRYDGKSKPVPEIEELYRQGRAVLVCPESDGGLSTPRPPSEIIGDKVISKEGVDVTENYRKGAQKTLQYCLDHNIKKAILKAKSPSCGSGLIYDGTFSGTLIPGDGITTQLLKENGIEVIDENDFLKGIK